MVDPVVDRRIELQPGRLLVAALLAVAAFALVIAFVSASAWHIDGAPLLDAAARRSGTDDLKFLAAIGGTMLYLVTGCIVYCAVRFRRAAPPSGVFDEDLPRREPQDAAGAGEDRQHEREVQQA